jgi:hypothetical protein
VGAYTKTTQAFLLAKGANPALPRVVALPSEGFNFSKEQLEKIADNLAVNIVR